MHYLLPTMDGFSMGFVEVHKTRKSKDSPTDSPKDGAKDSTVVSTVGSEADSDECLLIAVGNSQDTAAFNKLFARFAGRVFALGMKLTRNEQLSDDLVQEAMLTVWQKAPLYDLDRGTAKSWIFTLTRNRCFDMLRKIKRQPSCVSADDIWPGEGGDDNALVLEERVLAELEVSRIERYYRQLPEPQQAVVEQIFIFDRTHEEAAATLRIPLGTLKSRLRLGVGKLRQLTGVGQ